MKKTLFAIVLMSGCLRNQGTSFQLRENLAPSDPPACSIDVSQTLILTDGIRDTNYPLSNRGYLASLRVFNGMTEYESVNVAGRGDVRSEVNNLTLQGFLACYEFQNERAVIEDSERLPDCEDLGGAQLLRSTASTVLIGGPGIGGVDLFPPNVTANDPRFSPAAGQQVTIRVHLQAVAFTQDGRQMLSNEMVYPVVLCNGCLSSGTCAANSVIAGGGCILGQDAGFSCTTP